MDIATILKLIPSTGPMLLSFDRDGTLVPYANHPDDAVMEPELKSLMRQLAKTKDVAIALLSARSVGDLENDFGKEDGVILSGNYGLELKLQDGKLLTEKRVEKLIPELQRVKGEFIELTNKIEGLIFEDHRLSLCLHWHNVKTENKAQLNSLVREIASQFVDVRLETYPTSFEVFPDIEWTKGNGLTLIREHSGLNGDGFVLFAGDTDSDEPAIKLANDLNGVSIRVGKEIENSAAKYRFESPAQVKELLSQILNLRS